MAPRKLLPIVPQPAYPRLAPGNQSDPRGFGNAYGNQSQPDQQTQANLRERMAPGVVPFDSLLDRLDANNLPPQLKQGKKLALIPGMGVANAQLLIPQSPQRRFSFVVSNFLLRNLVLFSYGRPMDTGGGVGEGMNIGNYYQEANGTISIDDIYVFCNDPGETYPFYVCGYEGSIAPGGNKA